MADATTIYVEDVAALTRHSFAGLRTTVHWKPASDLLDGRAAHDEPAVLLASASQLTLDAALIAPEHVVVVAEDAAAVQSLGGRADVALDGVADATARARVLDTACRLARSRLVVAELSRDVAHFDWKFHELSSIGMALMYERDRSALLQLIVSQGKRLTQSDGAGLLLLETDKEGIHYLYPKKYEFDSLPDLSTPTIRHDVGSTSVLGHAALTKQPIILDDVRAIPPGSPYVANLEFERRFGYYIRSFMAVPMLDHQDRVLGVLFFVNRKLDPTATIRTKEDADRVVSSYDDRHMRLARSLASQAAVSIENARLYLQLETMLESLVTAAVSAIDERDPTTAGHSLRVATLSTALAEAIDRSSRGQYRDRRFTRAEMRELHYAALLHDLGKVAVREDVLVKAKKLPPALWERVDARFELIRRTIELEACRGRGDVDLESQLAELDRLRAIVHAANEPTVDEVSADGMLVDIARRTFRRADGTLSPYLTPEELRFLQLSRGTLDEHERAEIEAHVSQTYRFLRQIPWTEDLKNLALYARGHHEKLDGSGYPKGLKGDDIPVQTRVITLADIFDALTEADRPYKPAVSPERALDILQSEAAAGKLDRDLVTILTESQVYRSILPDV